MRAIMFRGLIVIGAILALPVVGHAQEATILGAVTDATGGVLPGVTITVIHEASGNSFTAVTNDRGEYRIPVRTGPNKFTAELSGFSTANRTLDLLVGQQAVLNLQMTPAGVAETVTVTGESPLIDVIQSKLGGNIDPKQMSELPVQGRNFIDLTMLAPGARANMVGDTPFGQVGTTQVGFGSFQLNVDGQQITQNCCAGAGGQPRFSRDAIAEFQFSGRFDATQGRSAGVQINVISKSGTNGHAGTFSGFFRDDSMIAKDFLARAVLPYSNQQLAGTYGGPLVKDKAHYFANYEYEREPNTFIYQSTGPTAAFNRNLSGTRKERKGDARLDFQLSSGAHLMLRGNNWHNGLPYDQNFGAAGAINAPSAATQTDRYSDQVNASLTKVLTARAVNEVKIGHSGQHWASRSVIPDWVGGPNTFAAPRAPGSGVPNISFSGYSIGTPTNIPQRIGQDVYSVRDDFTYLYEARGRHDLKTGGEYQNYLVWHDWCNVFNGQISYSGTPPSNIASFFPDPMNPATWDLVGLSSVVAPTQYAGVIGDCRMRSPRNIGGAWVQDDWQVSQRLTANLGLRWDGETGTWANEIGIPPFLAPNRPNPLNNWGPRLGGAFKLNDRTVIRGGWGIYYSEIINQTAHNTRIDNQQLRINTQNTARRPDFAINPYNGPTPTFDQALASFCSTQNVLSNCVLRSFSSSMVSPYQRIPYSYQASIGFQRQIQDSMMAEMNFVWTGLRHDRLAGRVGETSANTNLVFDPLTGVNLPFSNALTPAGAATRAYPQFGVVPIDWSNGRSDARALDTSFSKRFSNRWQAQATYSLSYLYDAQAAAMSGPDEVPFKVANDLGYEYTLAASDQRHRATFNGIWQIGYGFQLSGLYFFGSGQRFPVTCGADNRNIGVPSSTGYRLCSAAVAANPPAGVQFEPGTAILVRNQFVGLPIHRVDVRLMRQFRLLGSGRVDATLEVFNLFNHENFGNYTTIVTNSRYGQPSQVANVVYNPRTVQLGFRFAF